ncbi:SseB family protein [Streptomyces sp. NBC_01537]|uniref:SseB family protein n=1 Tax=Streptomyces sp. NBC_01537 TaxID=2903896 RepID=UPI003870E2A7
MALKNIPEPGFSDDDGTADPRLSAALSAYAGGAGEGEVLTALRGARLLVPVVALLGEVETGPDGLRREKTSDMAVPTIQAADGRRALPAFTSTDALARWRPDARPVAVPLTQALQALAHERADTLLIDMAGPVPYALSGPALRAVAEGRDFGDPLADPAVREAVRAAVAAEPGVVRAHLVPADTSDGTLGLVLAPDAAVQEVAQRVATALAGDDVLRGALVKGLELALLPAGARLPGEPLFSRTPAP